MRYYKKKDMYFFSDDEKKEAHNISVIDYLEKNYGFAFKKVRGGYRCVQHNSLFVHNDEKSWFWNSQGFGGGDIIAFIQKYDKKSYAEALLQILQPSAHTEYKTFEKAPENPIEPQERELILPPKKNGKYTNVFAYLTKTRCIDPAIVSTLLHKKFLYQDTHNNCVFVGYNKAGLPAYASIRTTLTNLQYRKEAIGSDKNNGFFLYGYDKCKIFVFEAPIDLLSHATLSNIAENNNRAWLNESRLSLGGVCDNALEHYLKDNPECSEICFCLDNDPAGIAATEKYTAKYLDKGYKVTSDVPLHKDFNEDLQSICNKTHQKIKK